MSSSGDSGDPSSSSTNPASQLRMLRARQAAMEAAGWDRDSDESSDEEQQERQQTNLAHAQSHNLVDSLLPSPSTTSPPRPIFSLPDVPSSRSRTSLHRPGMTVTVCDIKNRTCWICSDGDEGDARPDTVRRWVHPCKCSLIAHESCLLTWIRSRRASGTPDPNRVITCPQCSYPYTIVETKPAVLKLFEAGDGVLRSLVPIGGAAVLGGGILIAATAYGCTAIRLWMGEPATRRLLGGKWPWHFYFDIPLIPLALIASRLRFCDRALLWLTTVSAFPMTQVPFASAKLTWTHPYAPTWRWRNHGNHFPTTRIYPPGPALTVMLAPCIRIIYLSLKRKITRRVLSRFVRKSSNPSTVSNSQRNHPETIRRVIIVGQENPLVDAEGLGDVGLDDQGRPREVPPGADSVNDNDPQVPGDREGEMEGEDEQQGVQQTIYVTPQSLSRLILGALSTPLIANVMGRLLAKLAGWSFWIRRLLGMQLRPSAKSFGLSLASFNTPSSSKSAMGRLLSSGSTSIVDELEEERILYNNYDDLDPVWFRNAIGAGLFIVAKDAFQLGFRYLRLDHAKQGSKRTRIIDRPFEGTMIDGLDLR